MDGKTIMDLAAKLPEGVHWGDPLTPEVAEALAAPAPQNEPAAYCQPDDPCNRTAFAWPGTDREDRHSMPLYAHPAPTLDLADLERRVVEIIDAKGHAEALVNATGLLDYLRPFAGGVR